jgi:hypothetical protein
VFSTDVTRNDATLFAMQRRTLLGLGVAGAAVVSLVGVGAAWMHEPAWGKGRLLPPGRDVLRAVANAVLDGSLPEAHGDRGVALEDHLRRVQTTVAGMPAHVQDELGTLLSLLSMAPLRRTLAGLPVPWNEASVAQVQTALQSMRSSTLMLRRQAYGALRDLTHAAYFADPATWPLMRYPGPRTIA